MGHFLAALPPAALADEAILLEGAVPFSRAIEVSDYSHPGRWTDTAWSRERVAQEDGAIVIDLRPAEDPAAVGDKRFVSGEIRHRADVHYGRYEVVMQAAQGDGLNSAFFTYTGPHRGDPHDEIDFEFLGQDTTRVYINVFADKRKMPGESVALGFDAAAGPHLYAFEWLPDRVTWYADGRLLYQFAPEDISRLPATPSQIYLSLWAGSPGIRGWLGLADPQTTAEARYWCVSYVPLGGEGVQCSDRGYAD
ncbi:MAG: family 16 glycosylhydrolase [Pseudomonadota bacterium]